MRIPQKDKNFRRVTRVNINSNYKGFKVHFNIWLKVCVRLDREPLNPGFDSSRGAQRLGSDGSPDNCPNPFGQEILSTITKRNVKGTYGAGGNLYIRWISQCDRATRKCRRRNRNVSTSLKTTLRGVDKTSLVIQTSLLKRQNVVNETTLMSTLSLSGDTKTKIVIWRKCNKTRKIF